MPRQSKKVPTRDDAEAQPESGYPGGRLTTKPSAEVPPKEKRSEAQAGSEAEFDSAKLRPNLNASI